MQSPTMRSASAARHMSGGVSHIRAALRQFVTPTSTELARNLAAAVRDLVRPAVFIESPSEFERYVEANVETLAAYAMALGAQSRPTPEPPPHLHIGERLVELLGEGADAELEFCEYTLWAALRRALEAPAAAHREAVSLVLFAEAAEAVFAWVVLAVGGLEPEAHPAAMRAALRLLRDDALRVSTLADELGGAHDGDTLELMVGALDAEDLFLAMDPEA